MKSILFTTIAILSVVLINNSIYCQNNISITGKIATPQTTSTEISSDSFLFFDRLIIASSAIDETGNFSFNFKLSEPGVYNIFNKSFYMSPGDSINFQVQGNEYNPEKIVATGRNANNYVLSIQLDSLKRKLPFNPYVYKFENDLDHFCDSLALNKTFLLNRLSEFCNNHPLSNQAIGYFKALVTYNYYDQLLYPLSAKKININQLTLNYQKLLNGIELKHDSLARYREYLFTAIGLIDYKAKNYQNFKMFDIINDNSVGLTREFLLTKYAYSLVNKYTSKDSLLIENAFKKIDTDITDNDFRTYFDKAKGKIGKYLNPLPKEVLQTIVMDSIGNKSTFSDLLIKGAGKVIVLDFWASWCGPCKKGMPLINQLKDKLNNKQIIFDFISVDKTEMDWRKGMETVQVPGNHFWVDSNFKSALAQYLDIKTIPRYVIINKSGKIEKLEARDPSEGNWLSDEIESVLNQ